MRNSKRIPFSCADDLLASAKNESQQLYMVLFIVVENYNFPRKRRNRSSLLTCFFNYSILVFGCGDTKMRFSERLAQIAFPNSRSPLVEQCDPEGWVCLTDVTLHVSLVSLPEVQVQENNYPNSNVSRLYKGILWG